MPSRKIEDSDKPLRLRRTFGNEVLVVLCLPENKDAVADMLSHIPENQSAYDAMGKVRGAVESIHVEKLDLEKA